jgi:TM2 domain-containing membrane protein YozV
MTWQLSCIVLIILVGTTVLGAAKIITGESVIGVFTTVLAWISKSPLEYKKTDGGA